jgi:Uma2 family endonuclease
MFNQLLCLGCSETPIYGRCVALPPLEKWHKRHQHYLGDLFGMLSQMLHPYRYGALMYFCTR